MESVFDGSFSLFQNVVYSVLCTLRVCVCVFRLITCQGTKCWCQKHRSNDRAAVSVEVRCRLELTWIHVTEKGDKDACQQLYFLRTT